MAKKLLDLINFYLENQLNEIYLEKPINRFKEKSVFQTNDEISNANNSKNFINKANSKKQEEEIKEQITVKKNLITNNEIPENLSQLNNTNEGFMSLNQIVALAQKQAKMAKTIEEVKTAVENFEGCNLKKMATNTVFCDGNINSKIMVIGEAPGNQEDLEGIPFCGDSGELLDGIFKSINFIRSRDFYITNAIFWRPPGNRRPTAEELAICRPFVERNIELFSPKIIVLVGSTAMNCLISPSESISSIRGKIIDYSPDFLPNGCKILTIFHPSYLMRQPSKKKLAWLDMLNLKKFIENNYEK
jgi:DNA polymerase